MKFELSLRSSIQQQIQQVAETMKAWDEQPHLQAHERTRILDSLFPFNHTTASERLIVAGVEGNGDFPALTYADSFVYIAVANAVIYRADRLSGLSEMAALQEPLVQITWMPDKEGASQRALYQAFAELAGLSIEEVIARSDYQVLKAAESGRSVSVQSLIQDLICPDASDTGNIAIQLRATAELGAAYQIITGEQPVDYVLFNGTFSLPLVNRSDVSLFYEHLKRLCCVEARQRGIGFFALSQAHGLPSMEHLEALARERAGLERGSIAEHWYLRLPMTDIDDWQFSLANRRRLPPVGAVTYLVRFHRTTPVMRLDIDRAYWQERVQGATDAETHVNEQRLFADLDYTCHDQRCYGYPYPIHACHHRVSLSRAERGALRKQIIDAAVKTGMKRSLFRESDQARESR
jgi:hypothetical protein